MLDFILILLILPFLFRNTHSMPTTAETMIEALQKAAQAIPDLHVGGLLMAKELHKNYGAPKPRFQVPPEEDGFWLFSLEGNPEWVLAVQVKGAASLTFRIRYRNISRRQLLANFREELARAQSQRNSRSDWVEFERATMLGLVNEERRLRGLPGVSLEDILRVETMAEGHFDYSKKFALYCAEMATGADSRKIEP